MSNQSLSVAIQQIERYLEDQAGAERALQSHRSGVQFALFAVIAAMKLSPEFNVDMLRQFAQTALDNPPQGFERDMVFREPLTLLLALTEPEAVADFDPYLESDPVLDSH